MISLDRQVIPSRRVRYYADRVIKDLQIKEPPVLYLPVLDYFGLELIPIDEQIELQFKSITGNIEVPPAFLLSNKNGRRVYVKNNELQPRKRLSIFHECAHHDLPWHTGHDFFCDCLDTDFNHNKAREREAFEYAAGLIFPSRIFFEDINSLSVEVQTIELLAKRYNASFIATAINYVKKSPENCALIMMKYTGDIDINGAHFCVAYSIKSKSFHRYWQKGAPIFYNDYIMSSFEHKRPWECEIPACVFGSDSKLTYKTNLRPYGDNVFALLYYPEIQTNLFRRT